MLLVWELTCYCWWQRVVLETVRSRKTANLVVSLKSSLGLRLMKLVFGAGLLKDDKRKLWVFDKGRQ